MVPKLVIELVLIFEVMYKIESKSKEERNTMKSDGNKGRNTKES